MIFSLFPCSACARRLAFPATGLLLALALSACGGSSNDGSSTATPPAATTPAVTPTVPDAALKADMRCAP